MPAITYRAAEIGTSIVLALLGLIVMYGAMEQGIGWDDTGPQAGLFPFYIGLILLLASLGTFFSTLRAWSRMGYVITKSGDLKRVLKVFIPIVVYVAIMPVVGMYVAAFLFICWFMLKLKEGEGSYKKSFILLISVAVPCAIYFIFAVWFEVPLYEGLWLQWLH